MNNQLPEAFLDRVRKQLGDELPAFLSAMAEEAVRGIRYNPLKPEGKTACPNGREPIPWEENGYYLAGGETPGITIWHEAGAFYLQDPAAMIPVNVLKPQPGERILDLCAVAVLVFASVKLKIWKRRGQQEKRDDKE